MQLTETTPIEGLLGPWSDGPGPLHRKLSDALRNAVQLGYLRIGDRLPAERELALRLSVSRSTVVAAYDTLRAEGVVESRQGSGTRVAAHRPGNGNGDGDGRQPALADAQLPSSPVFRALLREPRDVLSLATAVFPAHRRVAEAIREVALDDIEALLALPGYLPAGLPLLRERLAEMHSADGLPTTPDQVLVTTGAQQAIALAAVLFVRPGDQVVVEEASFAGTLDVFRTRGARLASVPLEDDGVDVRAVREAVANGHPSVVYVMPTFHNPTGVRMAEWRRRELAELAARERLPIVEDNALEFAPLDDERIPPIAAFAPADAPVVTVGSLGKATWGGLRIGWLRAPAPLVARLGELKATSDLGSALFDQAVAARLVPHLAELRHDYRTRLRHHLDVLAGLLAEHLPEWQWRRPTGGPSLWVRLPTGKAAAFAQVALRHGVEVIPGEVMSATADHRQHFRLPFTEAPPVLAEIVRRLAAAWGEYAPSDEPLDASRTVVV
jgi:DNA-binding transcriptional MocR family regulator